MSQLRKQLDDAKADYESARYPGDLAADVFARQATRSRSFWRTAAPYIAAAACVLLAVGLFWLRETTPQIGVIFDPVAPTDATTKETNDATELAALPAPEAIPESSTLPSDLPLVPSMSSESIPSPPSLASMDFSSDQSSF